ncbi:MAG: 4a-hydroxytetrahydrobiopterin dehydratase [Candidatus Eisenbacteria bacterium]|nr:4a-hydroxytetrahydrobiopterin dehydratase [Candidatus Eisenbacteria bacterium]
MDDLKQATCVPCRGGVPPLTAAEIAELRPHAPAWDVVERDGILRLERAFAFKDFRAALDFTVEVGELAEREQHHPDIHLSWGKVVVETWTHKIRGLHRNDFILAAKTETLYAGSAKA